MLPTHLDSKCATTHGCRGCGEATKQAPTGRWFITMGHPGFNSTANNRNGYATEASAMAALRKYASPRPSLARNVDYVDRFGDEG